MNAFCSPLASSRSADTVSLVAETLCLVARSLPNVARSEAAGHGSSLNTVTYVVALYQDTALHCHERLRPRVVHAGDRVGIRWTGVTDTAFYSALRAMVDGQTCHHES